MNIKNKILGILKSTSLDLSILSQFLNEDEAKVKSILDEMISEGDIKYNENLGLYKVCQKRALARIDKDDLYNYIVNGHHYFFNEILRYAKNPKTEFSAVLDELIKEGRLHKIGNIYSPILTATITVKPQGYGFASVEGEDNDYFIPEDYLNGAYDKDIVRIAPYEEGPKLTNAYVVSIVEHSHKFIVGKLIVKSSKNGNKKGYIISSMESFKASIDVKNVYDYHNEDIVYANLIYSKNGVIADIINKVGNINDPGIEIKELALEYGFKYEFSNETYEEVRSIPENVTEDQYNGRVDYRLHNVITIDGDDSKDFDDAVYLEKNDDMYKLYVHIADVSNYVTEGSALNTDALSRGTSLYLADGVIPMLPFELSNGICSLNEGVDRLVLSCVMEFDKKGNLKNYEINEGVINSHHRMTYSNVNKILNNDEELINKYSDIYEMLLNMNELSKILRARRTKRGAIDFEADEYKFILNENKEPVKIIKRTRDMAEMLIEDFMLVANETVAYHMNIMNLPCIYRVHEKPDQEKLHMIFNALRELGVNTNYNADITPYNIQDTLNSVDDNENKDLIHSMILRGMMKAKYSENCLGHYGLAMNYYCHFTSPIRRYPDLYTHRMIKNLYLRNENPSFVLKYKSEAANVALLTSSSEKRSVECERACNDLLYAKYMEHHIGDRYNGVIVSITGFGMFVEIGNGIEGLISYSDMDGYFEYDEKRIIATDGRIIYHLGDKVNIVVVKSNPKNRKIDFVLESDYKEWNYENYLFK